MDGPTAPGQRPGPFFFDVRHGCCDVTRCGRVAGMAYSALRHKPSIEEAAHG
jgi:hypothetical protein